MIVTDKSVPPGVRAPNVHIKYISLTAVAARVSNALNEAGLADGGARGCVADGS